MNFTYITFERDSAVAKITLNRPERANSMDLQFAEELAEAAVLCDTDTSIRAVLITGAGSKMFSAGGDIETFIAAGDSLPADVKRMTTALHMAISRFMRMDAPIVIAVNGVAAGGGLSLALCGDVVLGAASSKFTTAYTGIGITADGGMSYLLPRMIGMRRAQHMMHCNLVINAPQAHEWGILTEVVADDALQTEALALATKLSQGPTLAHGDVKRLLLQTFEQSLECQMELESRSVSSLIGGTDGREGIKAFSEGRKPQFKGER